MMKNEREINDWDGKREARTKKERVVRENKGAAGRSGGQQGRGKEGLQCHQDESEVGFHGTRRRQTQYPGLASERRPA